MTHAELVQRAAAWLSRNKCKLVLSEPQCWAVSEFPDAIGWTTTGYSILIECKVSVADFKRDAIKPSKRYAKSSGTETMGDERYFLTPEGLLKPSQVPESYGLLEVRGRRIVTVKPAAKDRRPGSSDKELPLLIWALRRGTHLANGGRANENWGSIRLVVERAAPSPPIKQTALALEQAQGSE